MYSQALKASMLSKFLMLTKGLSEEKIFHLEKQAENEGSTIAPFFLFV